MRRLILGLIASLTASTAAAAATPPLPPPPTLLVVISVDQLSADLWDEYRPHFTGGLARMASGTAFRNGFQSHAATETCPGHSTMLTGHRPARTGIIANNWIDQSVGRPDKTIYCAEDERWPGSSSRNYKASPLHLRVPTLGQMLKRQWPASRNVAVSGKDRAALMMGGHQADQRWYWDGKAFATDLGIAPPPAVARATAAVTAAIAAAEPPLETTPLCAARAQPFTLPGGLVVGNGALARAAGDANAFRASPQYDAAVLALAAALVQDLRLGSGPAPDLLSVGLSATDHLGHGVGSGGQEMCLQLLSLDRSLGDFFRVLDGSGVDYAVVLTADHGVLDIPERLRAKGVADAAWVDPQLEAEAVGKAIAARLKLAGPVLHGDIVGDVYLDKGLSPVDRARALREALAAYRAHPQVAGAYSRDQVEATAMPSGDPRNWSLLERLRGSYDRERSGDIHIVLKRNIMPIPAPRSGYAATHGSPWDYDRRVPVAFWRRGMPATQPAEAVETADILPTAAAILGFSGPLGAIDGRCLASAAPCAAVAPPAPERGR